MCPGCPVCPDDHDDHEDHEDHEYHDVKGDHDDDLNYYDLADHKLAVVISTFYLIRFPWLHFAFSN